MDIYEDDKTLVRQSTEWFADAMDAAVQMGYRIVVGDNPDVTMPAARWDRETRRLSWHGGELVASFCRVYEDKEGMVHVVTMGGEPATVAVFAVRRIGVSPEMKPVWAW